MLRASFRGPIQDAAVGGQKEGQGEGPERKRQKEEGPSPTKETVSALFHGVVLCAKRNRKKRFFLIPCGGGHDRYRL